jgi:hypothetical protein
VQERRVVMDHDRVSTIINFNAPIMHYHDYHGNVYYGKGEYVDVEEEIEGMPTPEQMCKAIEKTMDEGLWWANTAWAVVFRIYQMKGYMGSISQFVREVGDLPFKRHLNYECNDDAVSKPLRTGKLTGLPQNWINSGAHRKHQILAEKLLDYLNS